MLLPFHAYAKLEVINDRDVEDLDEDALCDERYENSIEVDRGYADRQYTFDMEQAGIGAVQDMKQNELKITGFWIWWDRALWIRWSFSACGLLQTRNSNIWSIGAYNY